MGPMEDQQAVRTIHTDVLVIGNGGAGLRAAIEASRQGAEVLVVARTILGKAHTTMAEGGFNAVLGNIDPSDSVESHFKDTVTEGAFLNDQRLVEMLVNEAAERIYDLEGFGAVFDRTPQGWIAQRPFGGQGHARTCYLGDETGHEIIMALVEEARRRHLAHKDEVLVTKLLMAGERCCGAFALEMRHGEYLVLQAKSTVLAMGGAGRIFQVTSNPDEATGDGYALAYEAGAELMDMEQVQFHPTGMVLPKSARGILVTEAARAEGGQLLNARQERFMTKYDPARMELAPRDVVARAIWTEVAEGRGAPSGAVYLDLTRVPSSTVLAKLPRMHKQFLSFANLDITKQMIEVAPTQHHFMGGVKIRPEDNRSTTVQGLYLAGENEAGVHGANRLGGNALAETQVFGARAGRFAALHAISSRPTSIPEREIEGERERLDALLRPGLKPQAVKEQLRDLMWRSAGIVRNGEDLGEALYEIQLLRGNLMEVGASGSKRYNLEWHDAISLPHMLLVSECVVRSALMRAESRGAHFRSDHPQRNDGDWLSNINILRSGDGSMLVYQTPVQVTWLRPKEVA